MISGIPARRHAAFFTVLVLCYLYFFQIYPLFVPTNELSRLLLTSAVVEDGTFQIDRAILRYSDSEDKARFAGHTYSDKAIGISLLSIPPFLLLNFIQHVFKIQFSAGVAIFFLRIFVVTIPALLFIRLLARFWDRLSAGTASLIPYFIFLLLFGTIAFPYSLQLISHYLLGILLFVPVYLLSPFRNSSENIPAKLLWASGAATGLALTMEYPAAIPAAFLCIYVALIVRRWKAVATFLIPIVVFIALMLSYNYAIFGTPFDVTYRHMTDRHIEHHAHGLIGVSLPHFEALWGLLFSRHHGLFFISPLLLFAIPGLIFMIRSAQWRVEGLLFSAISLSIFLVYGGFFYWIGGWAVGPRYLAPLMPFLMTAVYYFFTRPQIRSSALFRIAGISTALLSVLFVLAGTITFPYPPDVFSDPFFFVFFPILMNGAQGINLGELLGFSPFGSVLLFVTILILAFLVAVVPAGNVSIPKRIRRETLVSFALAGLFVLICAFTTPLPDARQYYGRGLIYAFCGRYKEAQDDMTTALIQNDDKELEKRIRGASFQINNVLKKQQSPYAR